MVACALVEKNDEESEGEEWNVNSDADDKSFESQEISENDKLAEESKTPPEENGPNQVEDQVEIDN